MMVKRDTTKSCGVEDLVITITTIIIKKKCDLPGMRDHHDCIWSVICTHARVNIIHIAKRNCLLLGRVPLWKI